MKKTISTLLVLSMMLLGVSFDTYAKGGSSGGGRSSSSSSSGRSGFSSSSSSGSRSGFSSGSSSSGSKSGFSSGSSSSGSTTKPSSGFSSGSSTSKPSSGFSSSGSTSTGTTKSSSSAINNYNSSKTVAPVKSKADFMADFKKQNEAKYPNSFTSQPSTRPSYIPASTTVNGTSHNVDWNPTTRSYGYYNGPVFVAYDPIHVIGSSAYTSYVGSQPSVVYHSQDSGSGILTFFLIVGGIFLVIVVIVAISR